MIALRLLGLAMIALQGFQLYLMMGYRAISVLTFLIAAAGCWKPLQRNWSWKNRRIADAAVVLAYVLLWWVYFQHRDHISQQYQPNVSLAGALGLMMLQAIRFYWRDPAGLSALYPLLGALSMACAGDTFFPGVFRTIFFAGAMVFGVLAMLYFACLTTDRRAPGKTYRGYRYAALALCLVLSIGLAGGTAITLDQSQTAVGNWLMKSFGKTQDVALGNNPRVRLGNMSDFDAAQAEQIALQIVANDSPGYLRGQVYGAYESATWQALPGGTRLAPGGAPPPATYLPVVPDENLFPVAPASQIRRAMTVYPSKDIKRAMFTPESTGWIAMAAEILVVNPAGTVEAVDELNGHPYQALATPPSPPEPLDPEERAGYTLLPEDLAPRLVDLSASICGDRPSPLRKAGAIAQYFTARHNYGLDFEAPGDTDPLEHFLFATPPPDAHCEYFATGATLLLRAAGVPARYVTGVAVWERHPFAAHWVARNRDAHAWCEAWDPEIGWFIVEATPASGLPEAAHGDTTNPIRNLLSMASLQFRRLIDAVRQGAWTSVGATLAAAITGLLHFLRDEWWLVGIALVVTGAAWLLFRYIRRRRPRHSTARDTAIVRHLARQLHTMDRLLARRHRLHRPGHWTLHYFAREIDRALADTAEGGRLASWYRAWADLRYRPDPDPASLARLEAERRALHRTRTRR